MGKFTDVWLRGNFSRPGIIGCFGRDGLIPAAIAGMGLVYLVVS